MCTVQLDFDEKTVHEEEEEVVVVMVFLMTDNCCVDVPMCVITEKQLRVEMGQWQHIDTSHLLEPRATTQPRVSGHYPLTLTCTHLAYSYLLSSPPLTHT